MEVNISICLDCAQGFHNDCGSPCCCADKEPTIKPDDDRPNSPDLARPEISIPDTPILPVEPKAQTTGEREGMKWSKQDHAIKDLKSTGRKRAAVLYPLDRESPCEWRGLRYAGGGIYPIIGCTDGLQRQRHHGPYILTLANYAGNVHRICDNCHGNWHTCNDPFIKTLMLSVIWRPHDGETKATQEELDAAKAIGRVQYSHIRFAWRVYNKERDSFKELLEGLKSYGTTIANPWLAREAE